MPEIPVELAQDLPDLCRRLSGQPEWGWVRDADPGMLEKALAAPAALAFWLSRQTELPETLRLLVVGAEWLDSLDDGRWYQSIGVLVGRPGMKVSVTLSGPELGPAGSGIAVPEELPAAELVRERLSGTVTPDRRFDLAALFQPGLEQADGVLEGGALAQLARSTPLVMSAYSADEQVMEAQVLEAHGFTPGEALFNPFGLPVEGARWADRLWSVRAAPAQDHVVDEITVERVKRLSRMLAHSRMQGLAMAFEHYGTAHRIPTSSGEQRTLIHTMDGFYVDAATGKVYGIRDNALVATDRTAPMELVGKWPGMDVEPVERALWAAEFKARVLLDGSG